MPTRDEWSEEKIARMLDGTVFNTNRSKSITGTAFRTYGVKRPTCEIAAASLGLDSHYISG